MILYWGQLVRLPNLLIVALTLLLLRHKILLPTFSSAFLSPELNNFQFYALCLMTMLATAAGYVINDWYDYPIDKINRPEKIIVNKRLSFRKVKRFYFILVIIGALLAFFLTMQTGDWGIFSLYLFVSLLLFLYASLLKKSCLWGNITVALLCALVPGLLWYTEWNAITLLSETSIDETIAINKIFLAYIAFAFLATLFREIVKDLEDMEGDQRGGARTLPISTSVSTTKWVAGSCALLLMGSLLFWGCFYNPVEQQLIGILTILFLFLGTGLALFLLVQANAKAHFHTVSQIIKMILLVGLLYLMIL